MSFGLTVKSSGHGEVGACRAIAVPLLLLGINVLGLQIVSLLQDQCLDIYLADKCLNTDLNICLYCLDF